jgi:glycosyltransferase involved in cell wall biosynthesis
MLLVDVSHTSHTRAQTGIQRVVRSLTKALATAAAPVTYDPYLRRWRALESWETITMAATTPGQKRRAQWPLAARLRGRLRRSIGGHLPSVPASASGVLVPEVFSPAVASALPALFGATTGARVAVFHDAIALRLPELTPAKTVARFPAYLRELLDFDGIAAVSDDSRDALVDYWRWLDVSKPPPVRTIPLGVEVSSNLLGYRGAGVTSAREGAIGVPGASVQRTEHPPSGAGVRPTRDFVVLCVGSIEGRKNHPALLEACERLWSNGATFTLHLVGHAQTETGATALARVRALQAGGRPLRYDGAIDEAALTAAYAECAFTVYPSVMEGFGLPVLESMAHGKPCVCSARGALGEASRGGGCLTLDQVDAATLAGAMARLLSDDGELAQLATAAQKRKLRSWSDYAAEIRDWIHTLPRRRIG